MVLVDAPLMRRKTAGVGKTSPSALLTGTAGVGVSVSACVCVCERICQVCM